MRPAWARSRFLDFLSLRCSGLLLVPAGALWLPRCLFGLCRAGSGLCNVFHLHCTWGTILAFRALRWVSFLCSLPGTNSCRSFLLAVTILWIFDSEMPASISVRWINVLTRCFKDFCALSLPSTGHPSFVPVSALVQPLHSYAVFILVCTMTQRRSAQNNAMSGGFL